MYLIWRFSSHSFSLSFLIFFGTVRLISFAEGGWRNGTPEIVAPPKFLQAADIKRKHASVRQSTAAYSCPFEGETVSANTKGTAVLFLADYEPLVEILLT